VVVPDLTNPYYSEMVAAIEDAAVEMGWMVTLLNYQLDHDREATYLDKVFDDLPYGILYFPMDTSAIESIDEGRFAAGQPFVFVDAEIPAIGNGSVVADNAAGARLAARHFKATGRRRALFTGPPQTHPTSIARSDAFAEEAASLGLEVAHRAYGARRTIDAVNAALNLLRDDPTIDAFLAGNDLLAIHVYSELRRAGVRVPEDIAICGFDGIQIANLFSPRFTTIRQPIAELGRKAFELVTKPEDEPRSTTLPVELVIGETT
jgi:DNA-binding LacI/PurR family transcriptional regulator